MILDGNRAKHSCIFHVFYCFLLFIVVIIFFMFFNLAIFIEIQLICHAVLVSGAWQSDSVISICMYVCIHIYKHIYIYMCFSYSFLSYYKILNIIPCAVQ